MWNIVGFDWNGFDAIAKDLTEEKAINKMKYIKKEKWNDGYHTISRIKIS